MSLKQHEDPIEQRERSSDDVSPEVQEAIEKIRAQKREQMIIIP